MLLIRLRYLKLLVLERVIVHFGGEGLLEVVLVLSRRGYLVEIVLLLLLLLVGKLLLLVCRVRGEVAFCLSTYRMQLVYLLGHLLTHIHIFFLFEVLYVDFDWNRLPSLDGRGVPLLDS